MTSGSARDPLGRIVVSNIGTHPEPAYLAAGLKEAGHDVLYLTASTWPRGHWLIKFSKSALGSRIPGIRSLPRRQLPPPLGTKEVRGTSRWAEAIFQALIPLAPNSIPRLQVARTDIFRRRAGRIAASLSPSIVIGQYTSALEAFQLSGGALRVLMYPIAHHRWMAEHLTADAERNPLWAEFLQGNTFTPEQLTTLDGEIELADVIIVPGTFVARTFTETGVNPEKLVSLNLGVDLSQFPAGAPDTSARRGSKRGLQVLFVGQVNQRKGISYLLDGFAAAALPEAQLTIIGRASPAMTQRIAGQRQVRLIPGVPKAEVARFMREADVLVLPSLAEGFPLVVMEAMSSGTACIVSPQTSAEDIIESGVNGLVVEADSDEVGRALRAVDGDREWLAHMSERARRRVEDFTWERYSLAGAALVADVALRQRRSKGGAAS